MLKPIYTFSPFGKSLYEPHGLYVQLGDKVANPVYGEFLHALSRLGEGVFYEGFIANQIEKDMKQGGGFVTRDDLKTYRAEERHPLRIQYRDYEIVTNPLPASGGILISLYLTLFQEALRFHKHGAKTSKHLLTLTEVMKTVEDLRQMGSEKLEAIYDLKEKEKLFFLWKLEQTLARSSGGTTHISVLDSQGNAASMTISNGEGSGYYVPGTGIMLNNMLGEDDLHPEGFHSMPPGMRVSSMMSPGFIKKDGQIQVVLGSGGSKRIKTAMLQVIINLLEFNMTLQEAIESPRIHLDDRRILQIEPGFDSNVIHQLAKQYKVNVWSKKNLYFGGVHAVSSSKEGWGDSRRGGSFIVLD